MLSASLAAGQEIDVDKIILTAPKFDPAGKPFGGPVMFKCDQFELRFSAYHKVTDTGDQNSPQPWMFVRFITEGDNPIVIEK
jgi:hypothetical protein